MEKSRRSLKLEKEIEVLKQKNTGLLEFIENQEELLDEYLTDNNNMKKSFYVVLNAIFELQEKDITNETLSESLSKVFNGSLCGLHQRKVEELFDVDEIIDGYSISKEYDEDDAKCDCPNCSGESLTNELMEFMEEEFFSSNEFKEFINDVIKDQSDEQ